MARIMGIRIGHGAYTGANRYAAHGKHAQALRDLLQRGARMADAQRALKAAKAGSHATCTRYTKSASGKWFATDAIEVTVIIVD